MKLSIITVNFASADKIQTLYESIQAFPPACEWELIIVDNFSSAAEQGRLQEIFRGKISVHVIELQKNFGFGVANNEGVRFASGEMLAIVNPDIEVGENCFAELLEPFTENSADLEKPSSVLALSKAEERDVTSTYPFRGESLITVPVLQTQAGQILKNTRRFPSFAKLVRRRILGMSQALIPEKPRSVEWAQGSFWVLPKSVFEKLNGFDDRFFLFLEDTDFCRRLRKIRGKIIQIPTARAFHSPDRLSGGNLIVALFRKTFWIHITSAVKYFWKWR